MKILVLLFALNSTLLFNHCEGQNVGNKNDSLQKYSYLITATKEPNNQNISRIATGFFIRVNKKLFVVCCYHMFTCVDVYHEKKFNPEWNTLSVRLFQDGTNKVVPYIIKLDSIKRVSPIVSVLKYPDIFIYQINDLPKNVTIYSIEHILFKENKRQNNSQKIGFFFGFPIINLPNPLPRSLNHIPSSLTEFKSIENRESLPAEIQQLKLDSLNIIMKPQSDEGASGAPVFYKCTIVGKEKKEWIEFAGIQSGVSNSYNYSVIVKGNELIKIIKQANK
jgi:hypothetical protein